MSVYSVTAGGQPLTFAADGTPSGSSSLGANSYALSSKAPPNYLNPADGMLYGAGAATVSQMNGSNSAVANWSMDLSSYVNSVDSLAVQPSQGGYVYAASAAGSKVVVIDPATKSVVTTFDTAISPRHIALSPDGGHLYIADDQNPFVIAYTRTGALAWVNLNVGGVVSNIATSTGTVATAAAATCGVPTFRISSDRASIHTGESATIDINLGPGSLPPCNGNIIAYFVIKTKAVNNVDFTFLDANGVDATQDGVLLQGPLTLTHLYSSHKKTLPVNISLKKDPGYYTGNSRVRVDLRAK